MNKSFQQKTARTKEMLQLNNVIEQYEQKLNSKVDQVVYDIISFSKKNIDVVLPSINKSINPGWNSQNRKKRQKSLTFSHKNYYSNSFKDSQNLLSHELQQTKQSKLGAGRAVGKMIYKKPKIVQREVEILSKQMRWNPFCQKNAIKAHQIQKGMLNLLQRGKIGRDVDIITAFEKGRPVLNLQPAIFHHAEQKFTRDQQQKIKFPKQMGKSLLAHLNNDQEVQSNHWAITGLPDNSISHTNLFEREKNNPVQEISLKDKLYLQFLHYKPCQNKEFIKFRSENIENWNNLIGFFDILKKFLEFYTHEIVFVDSGKLKDLSVMIRKPNRKQLCECIFVPNNKNKNSLISISSIKNKQRKEKIAKIEIVAAIMGLIARKKYQMIVQKRRYQKKICEWSYTSMVVKRTKKLKAQKNNELHQKHQYLQAKFKKQYVKIQEGKHYQIHIANKHCRTLEKYKQLMNTDIIRIFNLQNPNTHIIYLCPFQITNDTTSYYFKIMELQQIENYKQRVTFIDLPTQNCFPKHLSMSAKLFYNSKILRKIKRKIGDVPAYFITSYPDQIDIKLSVYLNIPIFSGNLFIIKELCNRSALQKNFNCDTLNSFSIAPKQKKLLQLSTDIIRYCSSVKNCKRFIVKLNYHYQSSGIALLATPFTSLPEIYNHTTIISPSSHPSPDAFFIKLAQFGGVIQKYDDSINPLTILGEITTQGQFSIIGTFDKVSYGFVNVAYLFPQKTVLHRQLIEESSKVFKKLIQQGHFGNVEITFFADTHNNLHLDKVQPYFTRIGSSLYYFKFLTGGSFTNIGEFMTKIYEDYEGQNQEKQEVVTLQQRGYCYMPYIIHFGFSERQADSFFQLCRMGGVSFDLQNKYGCTFILLGNIKISLGIISTAKDRKSYIKLMLTGLDFILKQNSHNLSYEMIKQKEVRLKQRTNITSLKQVIEGYI